MPLGSIASYIPCSSPIQTFNVPVVLSVYIPPILSIAQPLSEPAFPHMSQLHPAKVRNLTRKPRTVRLDRQHFAGRIHPVGWLVHRTQAVVLRLQAPRDWLDQVPRESATWHRAQAASVTPRHR